MSGKEFVLLTDPDISKRQSIPYFIRQVNFFFFFFFYNKIDIKQTMKVRFSGAEAQGRCILPQSPRLEGGPILISASGSALLPLLSYEHLHFLPTPIYVKHN